MKFYDSMLSQHISDDKHDTQGKKKQKGAVWKGQMPIGFTCVIIYQL